MIKGEKFICANITESVRFDLFSEKNRLKKNIERIC